jgi:SAM-dependent methyltransferase
VEHEPERRSIPPDYDEDHERFRLARSLVHRHSEVEDVHRRVAERMLAERLTPVLDVGCGEGELSRYLPEGAWVGLDSSAEMLSRAPHPSTQGKATALPFPDASFGAVALLYVLYHLDDPALALTEAQRVLRAGGMLAAAAPSQRDSPELAHALPAGPRRSMRRSVPNSSPSTSPRSRSSAGMRRCWSFPMPPRCVTTWSARGRTRRKPRPPPRQRGLRFASPSGAR